MPNVAVVKEELEALVGEPLEPEAFSQLCFQFGVELDCVTTEQELSLARRAQHSSVAATAAAATDRVVYKVDVPANRYDLLCVEGLGRALAVFRGRADPPALRTVPGSIQLRVLPSAASPRPFVVAAVLRGIRMSHSALNSFLDLQDKLHFNICRRRTLVAIGTHDLDTLRPPFVYSCEPGSSIRFRPLSAEAETDAAEYIAQLRSPANVDGKHLRPYADIIGDLPGFPVIRDSGGVVLSLPPVINGDHSRISTATRNCFIECTATDLTKANIVLNTIVAMFSAHCDEPFTVETVDVVYEADHGAGIGAVTYPQLAPRRMQASVDYINKLAGVSLTATEMCTLLNRMQLIATVSESEGKLDVLVPVTRSDVLHECDIAEDVAIAFGYNEVPQRGLPSVTVGCEQPINKLSDLLRHDMAMAGFGEVLTLALCSHAENFSMLRRPDDGTTAVTLLNPQSPEFQVARTSLLPGILKTLHENKSMSFKSGVRLFEVSDVVLKDASRDVGARNERRLVAVYSSESAGFEIIHGLLDRIMQLLHVKPPASYAADAASASAAAAGSSAVPFGGPYRGSFSIAHASDPTYFSGMCAEVSLTRADLPAPVVLGRFGVLHPEVIGNFRLEYPCSALEICIEPFL